jgi:hypothetical protein
MYLLRLLVIGVAVPCASCNARKPADYLSEPSAITLDQAMEQVTNGLQKMVGKRMEAEEEGVYQQLGLHASEVIITFNVTGSSTADGKLFVDLVGSNSPPPLALGRLGGEAGTVETASRGNQITIRFVNLLFATPDTLAGTLDAHDLHRLRYALSGKDPGPKGALAAPGASSTHLTSTAAPQAAAPTLPDLPPIAPAASDHSAGPRDISSTPEIQQLIKKLNKPLPTTAPATQPIDATR